MTAAPDPTDVLSLLEAFRRSQVMFTAVELGIFDLLESDNKPADDLARRLGADPYAMRHFLDACVCLGLLTRDGAAYANTPEAAAYLCRNSPSRLTGYIDYSRRVLWRMWANLPDAIREGGPRWHQTFGHSGGIFDSFYSTEEAKREFLLGLHGYGLVSSPAIVSAFDLGSFTHLVDLGGATGHLSIAACRRYPKLRATVFDLPGVIPLAQEQIDAANLSDRITAAAGDFFVDPLPAADLFVLGRILHDWPEERIHGLLRKIHAALPEGGALLIAEKLIAEDRNGPAWALLQSLNMVVTTEGRERTLPEYRELLKSAGFGSVDAVISDSPLDAMLASG